MVSLIVLLVGVALGYGFRGLIGRELRQVVPQVKNELAVVVADVKTEIDKIVADAKKV